MGSAGANTGLQNKRPGELRAERPRVCFHCRLFFFGDKNSVETSQTRPVLSVSPRTVGSSLQNSLQLCGLYLTVARHFFVLDKQSRCFLLSLQLHSLSLFPLAPGSPPLSLSFSLSLSVSSVLHAGLQFALLSRSV